MLQNMKYDLLLHTLLIKKPVKGADICDFRIKKTTSTTSILSPIKLMKENYLLTNLKKRLSFPPAVSSWYKKASLRSSKVLYHSSHEISSKVSSPE